MTEEKAWSNLNAGARTPEGTRAAADKIGCDVAALEAVMIVEAGKKGFDSKGRVVALFEPHIFYRELSDTPQKKKLACDSGLAYVKWGDQALPQGQLFADPRRPRDRQ